jgi:PEP-CTERM motif
MRFVTRMAGAAALGAAAAIGVGLSVLPAQAGYVVTLKQEGKDVVATGSGTINLAGLSFDPDLPPTEIGPAMFPAFPEISTGPDVAVAIYFGATGPAGFGSGGPQDATTGSGDAVAVDFSGDPNNFFIAVPQGYVSGGKLSSSATWGDTNFVSLGVTPGFYTWTWGNGANTFTLDAVAAPEPSTWAMMLLGFASLCFAGYRARTLVSGRRCSAASALTQTEGTAEVRFHL